MSGPFSLCAVLICTRRPFLQLTLTSTAGHHLKTALQKVNCAVLAPYRHRHQPCGKARELVFRKLECYASQCPPQASIFSHSKASRRQISQQVLVFCGFSSILEPNRLSCKILSKNWGHLALTATLPSIILPSNALSQQYPLVTSPFTSLRSPFERSNIQFATITIRHDTVRFQSLS